MNSGLWLAAAAMGLAGSPHCLVMCGTPCAAVMRTCRTDVFPSAQWIWHLARIASYAAVGAAVAGGVQGLGYAARELTALRPFVGMVQIAGLVLGLWLIGFGRQPSWLDSWGKTPRLAVSTPEVQPVQWFKSSTRAALVGGLWGAMPCGLLQSALVLAALGSGPTQGAAVMAVFALASGIGLILGGALWTHWAHRAWGDTVQKLAVRGAGTMLVAASAMALTHGTLWKTVSDWCL